MGDYVAEKMETQQALAALEKAMAVLSSNALLEKSKLQHLRSTVVRASRRVSIGTQQLAALEHLAHGSTGAVYAPQSATIQGILSDMYETFASNLEKAEHNEATLHRNYEKLIEVKQRQLLTLHETLTKKEQEKVEAETILAD